MKKICLRILCFLCALCLSSCALAESEICISSLSKYGNLILSVSGSEFLDMGYAYGDVLRAVINGHEFEMPICTDYTDVPVDMPVCRVEIDASADEDNVALALNASNLAQAAGIAQKLAIEEEPGYSWEYADGVSLPLPIEISVIEAGGYYDEWILHALTRTNDRDDYPQLTDAQFANFREITLGGVAEGRLYRSSSPVNPEIGRSAFADAAARSAGIAAVINLADSEAAMQAYPGFSGSYYAGCDVIGLNLSVDFTAPEFEQGLARGLRFMLEHDGPYLIHCNEGKDRAGFVSAVLECLMGAGARDVLDDYMVTYCNYYGVLPGSAQYDAIAEGNLKKSLETAFGLEDLNAAGVDLSAETRDYMQEKLGLQADEVDLLIQKLS